MSSIQPRITLLSTDAVNLRTALVVLRERGSTLVLPLTDLAARIEAALAAMPASDKAEAA